LLGGFGDELPIILVWNLGGMQERNVV